MPMSRDPGDDVVHVEVWIAASPEAVFPFLTNADRLLLWIGIAAQIDPVPGGVFLVGRLFGAAA